MTIENIHEQSDEMENQGRSLFGWATGTARRYLNAGVGAVSVGLEKASDFRHEKIEKGIDRLAERGQEVRARRFGSLNEAADTSRGMAVGLTAQATEVAGSTLESMAKATRERLRIASSDDIEAVSKQIDDLNQHINELVQPASR
jgi:hypothetical protein